ncbi:hypothetical protein D5S17_25610 [Pseudonocardiaceae bacterium YIM PH 21723]|nr:hypothetical protein D5S17_25610 [Pseudonocardiaceae bacterium YIM PH 21723]
MRPSGFFEWLHEYVLARGIGGIVETVLALLAFGGTLSVLFGSSTIKAAAVVAAIIGILGLLITSTYGRAELRAENALLSELLRRNCEVAFRHMDNSLRINKIHAVNLVKDNGDGHSTITVVATALTDQINVFKIGSGSGWHQPESARRKVKIQVSSIDIDGIGGVRHTCTKHWRPDGKLEILTHLDRPMVPGSTISIVVQLFWPGKNTPLIKKRLPDTFSMKLQVPVEHLICEVILPPGFDAFYEPRVPSRRDFRYSHVRQARDTGHIAFRVDAWEVEPDQRVGILLDLKEPRSSASQVAPPPSVSSP